MKVGSHNLVLIDAHVHFRKCFNIVHFLEWAHVNFESVAQDMSSGKKFIGVLFLADSPDENGFGRLHQQCNTADSMGGWRVHNTREPTSVQLWANGGKCLVIVAGRQIISRKKLEVLAVGTRRQFDHGRSVSALIRTVARANALPIIPWGAGKWLGRRGQLVENLIRSSELPSFFLGDSGNRPAFWPQPSLFRVAKKHGIGNLPGSDPLPFSSEVQRVGSFGVALNCSLDLEKPAQDLKRKLLDLSLTLHQFGEGETPLRFLRNQLKMQFRNLTQ